MAFIVPTILTQDPAELEEKIQKLTGLVDRVQIDIIDGIFLPERTVGPETLKDIETALKLDIHLMVKDPKGWISRCVDALADRVIGQVEMMKDQEMFINEAAAASLGVGLGLDLETPVTIIPPEILTRLDLVLVMTRKAGSIDYPFEERALEKVKNLRKAEFGGEVCVDGGINEENIKKCLEAGANLIAVGGAIWKVGEINEVIERLSDLTTR